MNGHSCAFLLLEVFRLFPESEGVSGDVFEDVLGIGEVTRGAFVGIRKRVHLMPNLKGSPATDSKLPILGYPLLDGRQSAPV